MLEIQKEGGEAGGGEGEMRSSQSTCALIKGWSAGGWEERVEVTSHVTGGATAAVRGCGEDSMVMGERTGLGMDQLLTDDLRRIGGEKL